MKKKVTITVIDSLDQSGMYVAETYPEKGFYLWEVNGQLIWFDGGVAPTGIWMEPAFCDLIELPPAPEEVIEDDLDEEFPDVVEIKSDPGPAMVSEDLFLKTVAILQDADIVTDLVKGSD